MSWWGQKYRKPPEPEMVPRRDTHIWKIRIELNDGTLLEKSYFNIESHRRVYFRSSWADLVQEDIGASGLLAVGDRMYPREQISEITLISHTRTPL